MADEQKPEGSQAPSPAGGAAARTGQAAAEAAKRRLLSRRGACPKPPATMAATPGIATWRAN